VDRYGRPPDRRHVQPEREIAHRGIAHDDDLRDLVAVDVPRGVEAGELVVERAAEGPAELARMLVVVRDARHDVAAAEALRVLEGSRRERLAGGEVDELEDDRRCADVQGEAKQPAVRGPQVVDRGSVVREEAHVPVDHLHRRIHLQRGSVGRHEDPEPPAKDAELDLGVVARHGGAAGEPVARPKEGFRCVGGSQGLAAGRHLDDALMAAPRAAARGRHDQLQLVCRVEERPPGNEGDAVPGMDEVRRHPRSIGADPRRRGERIGPSRGDIRQVVGGPRSNSSLPLCGVSRGPETRATPSGDPERRPRAATPATRTGDPDRRPPATRTGDPVIGWHDQDRCRGAWKRGESRGWPRFRARHGSE